MQEVLVTRVTGKIGKRTTTDQTIELHEVDADGLVPALEALSESEVPAYSVCPRIIADWRSYRTGEPVVVSGKSAMSRYLDGDERSVGMGADRGRR